MKIAARLALGLSLLHAVPAQADPQRLPHPIPVASEPAPAEPARPALWKVSDADTTIYLFGTIHVLRPDQLWFAGKIEQAADSADELVTEIGDVPIADIAAAISEFGLLPQGQTLRSGMTPEDKAAYEAAMTRIGLAVDAFDRAEPWYAANSLLLEQLRRADIRGANGPEALLTARFAERHRPRIALETIRSQLALFHAVPMPAQYRYLREVADQGGTIASEVDRIAQEWARGDAETLAAELNADTSDPEMLQRLLIDRNRAWSAWIAARLDRPGAVFIAVGAGHLAGNGSVQEQLAKLGITAVRVQ